MAVGSVPAYAPVEGWERLPPGFAHRDVKRQLLVQIAIEPPPVDDGDEAVPECLSVHRSRFFTKSEETKDTK